MATKVENLTIAAFQLRQQAALLRSEGQQEAAQRADDEAAALEAQRDALFGVPGAA
jgi:hypothetical protein